jgi:tellurite resistance protein TerC
VRLDAIGVPVLWAAFTGVILILLVIDLGVGHQRDKPVSFRRAAAWTVIYVVLAGLFGLFVWTRFDGDRALAFYTGYVIELALSVDNLFVFLMLFSYFHVPPAQQHRVLFWGILGALVMRALFIVAGAALLQRFHFVTYLFGLFLVVTGARLLRRGDQEVHPERNPILRVVRALVPVTSDFRGSKFLVREGGRLWATPLFVVLVAIEATDVVFALDSIPAIFGVTTDPFIVYTSNIFAILGLRSLYFLLSGLMGRFRYLPIGLALVLVFIGLKMLGADILHVPTAVSLLVVLVLLAGSIAWSLLATPAEGPAGPPEDPESPSVTRRSESAP